jgi:mannose-6-phosphate isomerase
MDRDKQNQVISDALINAQKFADDDQAYQWMKKLHNEYPADIGVFSPILLNLVCLRPSQAMFLPAGELHAYLDGVGIELMANSDNVLRGGLTPKHVDVPELMNVLNFEEREIDILHPSESNECERIYTSRADEFVLSVIALKKDLTFYSPINRSVEILLCTDGEVIITDLGNNDKLAFDRGKSIIIPAAVKSYCIEGNATLYKAAVPV